MKKIVYILVISIFTFSCEDVIDLNVPSSKPKLVIDASINCFKETTGNQQEIKLTLTAPYFENEVPPATNAEIIITDINNDTFIFTEEGSSGIYKNSTFIPVINGVYNLSITYQEELFTATEILKPVSSFEYIEQNNDGGFTGEEIEIKAYFTDPIDEENYYFLESISDISAYPNLDVFNDEFINGNSIFGFYTEEDLLAGDQIIIRNYGISKQFYNYMYILLQQYSGENGGPFETQPATVRGNCTNQTNPDNYPLGYFRLSEVDELRYTIE